MKKSILDVGPDSMLVLGNGFDLKCGLHSSFPQFYENEIKGKKENTNVWYLLFQLSYYFNSQSRVIPHIKNNNIKWMDIEGLIKEVAVERKFTKDEVHLSFVSLSYIQVLTMAYNNRNNASYFYSFPEMVMFKEYFKTHSQIEKNLNLKNEMFKFLYDELIRFKKDFSLYISEEVKRKGYVDNVRKLLLKILAGEEFFYLINFNYTTYSFSEVASFVAYNNINNVHGSAKENDGEIVIGFDSSDYSSNEDNNNALLLSKVSQKISLGIDAPTLPKTIKTIKFYGHSLGEQDYAYFHSIFDFYDISNSDVVLEFYFSKYGDTPDEIINNEAKYRLRIIGLIDDYSIRKGSTIKNLTSKLNFMNRLTMKEVDFE